MKVKILTYFLVCLTFFTIRHDSITLATTETDTEHRQKSEEYNLLIENEKLKEKIAEQENKIIELKAVKNGLLNQIDKLHEKINEIKDSDAKSANYDLIKNCRDIVYKIETIEAEILQLKNDIPILEDKFYHQIVDAEVIMIVKIDMFILYIKSLNYWKNS